MRIHFILFFSIALLLQGCPRFEAQATGGRCTPSLGGTCTAAAVVHGYDPAVLAESAANLAHPPPPISGGTMFVSDRQIVIGDSDRDKIWLVNAVTLEKEGSHELRAGDEPGRIHGLGDRVFALLRGSGELYGLAARSRTQVCERPRGVLVEADRILVTCASGELVHLNADGTAITARYALPDDLRDIVVTSGGRRFVSTFREAMVYELNETASNVRPFSSTGSAPTGRRAHLAYRMRVARDAAGVEVLVAAVQLDSTQPLRSVSNTPAYYASTAPGNDCVAPAVSAIERITLADQETSYRTFGNAPVPVDLVPFRNGSLSFLISAAQQNGGGLRHSANQATSCFGAQTPGNDLSHLTSVELLPDGRVATFRRDTGDLIVMNDYLSSAHEVVHLASDSQLDLGHALFFGASRQQVACASCHAEGETDGHVWSFANGNVLTPPVFAGIRNTAPFHWQGEHTSFGRLVGDTMVTRMGGPTLSVPAQESLLAWMDEGVPDHRIAPGPNEAVERGENFFRGLGRCATCHTGELLTDNQNHDVGTGGSFQTPSLVGLRHRTKLMHSGCASGVAGRLAAPTSCIGNDHGRLPESNEDRAGLLAYLRTL